MILELRTLSASPREHVVAFASSFELESEFVVHSQAEGSGNVCERKIDYAVDSRVKRYKSFLPVNLNGLLFHQDVFDDYLGT